MFHLDKVAVLPPFLMINSKKVGGFNTMSKYEQLEALNEDIQILQKERKKWVLEHYKNELLITINQIFFQNEEMQTKNKELIDVIDDTKCLLRTMQRYLNDDEMKYFNKEFQKNFDSIHKLLNNQENLLNDYLTKMDLYLK